VQTDSGYQLVRLNNGICSVRSLADDETFHPVVGPVAEAEALYVNQLKLRERLKNHSGEFVIWDVGLGAAANALTVLHATKDIACKIHLISFDHKLEPLEFALKYAAELAYFGGYENHLKKLFARATSDVSRWRAIGELGISPRRFSNTVGTTRRENFSQAARNFVRRLLARQKSRDVDAAAFHESISTTRPATSLRAADVFAQHDFARHSAARRIFRRRRPCHWRERRNYDCRKHA